MKFGGSTGTMGSTLIYCCGQTSGPHQKVPKIEGIQERLSSHIFSFHPSNLFALSGLHSNRRTPALRGGACWIADLYDRLYVYIYIYLYLHTFIYIYIHNSSTTINASVKVKEQPSHPEWKIYMRSPAPYRALTIHFGQ